jgi:uncharacterized protein (UPF0262 family)
MPEDSQRIVKLTLDERTVLRRSPDVEHERKVAIFDLLEGNHFDPADCTPGPYHLTLGIVETRLQFEVCDTGDAPLASIALPLLPFRRVVKEYFEICETYYAAIKTASPSRIEAIDMGRRGIHNEGSELLRERLAGKVELDFDTARRLFTLICVLHIKG